MTNEHYTEAIVLDRESIGESDGLVHFYTLSLGRVTAKAVSLRKITSKLSAHLEPGNLVNVRLVQPEGGRMQVVDALKNDMVVKKSDAFNVLNLVKELSAEGQPDFELWELLKSNDLNGEKVLRLLGFDNQFASCGYCGSVRANHFLFKEFQYSCALCFVKAGRPDSFVLK